MVEEVGRSEGSAALAASWGRPSAILTSGEGGDKPGSLREGCEDFRFVMRGGNDARQSWHTEGGSSSHPGPGCHP